MLLKTKKEYYAAIFWIIVCIFDSGFISKKGYSPMQYVTYKPTEI